MFLFFFACQNDVDYETNVKKSLETNNYFITSQNASTICFYKQNKYGDPELSTYEHDVLSDTSQTVPKGTSIAQLALKTYPGFTYYTAVQSGDTLNIYYSRNLVSYDFYSSKTEGKHLYNFSGLYDTSVTNPSFITDSDYYFIGWKDTDGNALGTKYGSDNKIFYPEVLSKADAIGTKGVADTKGDILLDDGSVISYSEFSALTDKTNIIKHAYAILVSTDYNSDYNTAAVLENDFYGTLEKEKTTLFNGSKKIIAGLFKDNSLYRSIPWISYTSGLSSVNIDGTDYYNDINDLYYSFPMNLINYLDGSVNTDYIKSIKSDKADYSKTNNAFSACESYGKQFATKTANNDEWYLPSLAELYALNLLVNDENYPALKKYFYPNIEPLKIWSSNVMIESIYYNYEWHNDPYYITQKALAPNAINSSIIIYKLERDDTLATLVLPFRKIN